MNDNCGSFQTLTDDLIQQQNHLKDAVNYAIHEETDMFIVSKDKEFLPCQKSLLSLFSPDIAYLLSEVPSCASPTIFLPDFLACHIRSFLHILQSGQTLPSEDFNVEVIHNLANVLKIQINAISIGHCLNNPLKTEKVKVEQSHSIEEQKSSIIKEEVMEDKANSKYVVQEKNRVKEVQVKKGNIGEYVEEEIIKQENIDNLDIDKVLDNKVDLQPFVDKDIKFEEDNTSNGFNKIDSDIKEEIYSKSPYRKNFTTKKDDGRVQEFNKIKVRPISNLVSNEHEKNWYEKDYIIPSSGRKHLVDEQIYVYDNQVQKSLPAAFTQYPCAECGTDFFDSKSLTKHTRNHHKPYTCRKPGCRELTVGYYRYAAHNKASHKKISSFASKHACECGRNFVEKKGLAKHQDNCPFVKGPSVSLTFDQTYTYIPSPQIPVYDNQVQKSIPAAFTQNKNMSYEIPSLMSFNQKQLSYYQTSAPSPTTISPTFSSYPPTVSDEGGTCVQCGMDFFDNKSLKKHTRNHHEPHTCTKPGCNHKTFGFYQMSLHLRAAHK